VQLIFGKLLHTEIFAFLDDCCLASKTVEGGIELLRRAFDCIRRSGLKLKASKCQLLQTTISLLGCFISDGCVKENPERAEVVKTWPFPKNRKQIRQFVGFAGFARNHYKDFASVIAPLTAMLRKDAKVERTPQAEQAFERVKEMMCTPPILSIFRSDADHTIACDASDVAVAACLKQSVNGNPPSIVAYASRKLSDAERNYCTTRKELLSVVFALKKWHHYLAGRRVVCETDHAALRFLLNGKALTPQLARYLDFIGQFDLQICHVPGKDNQIPDALSRRPCQIDDTPCKQCCAKRADTTRGNAGANLRQQDVDGRSPR
jgi:hypothetical protein